MLPWSLCAIIKFNLPVGFFFFLSFLSLMWSPYHLLHHLLLLKNHALFSLQLWEGKWWHFNTFLAYKVPSIFKLWNLLRGRLSSVRWYICPGTLCWVGVLWFSTPSPAKGDQPALDHSSWLLLPGELGLQVNSMLSPQPNLLFWNPWCVISWISQSKRPLQRGT